MASLSDATGAGRRQVTFRDTATFLKDYEANLRNGRLLVPWPDPPPLNAPVRLELVLPMDAPALEIQATVTFASPAVVGLRFMLNAQSRSVLESCAQSCRAGPAAPPPVETPPPPVEAPPPPVVAAPPPPVEAPPPPVVAAPPPIVAAIEAAMSPPDDQEPEAEPLAEGDEEGDEGGDEEEESFDESLEDPLSSPFDSPFASPFDAPFDSPFSSPFDAPFDAPAPRPVAAPPPVYTPPPAAAPRPAAPRPAAAPAPSRIDQAGTLEQTPLDGLMIALSQRKASGRLNLSTPTGSSDIYFERGNIIRIFAKPEPPGRQLGDMLVKAGKLREKDRDIALKEAQAQGIPLGEALINRGVVVVGVLKQTLYTQLLTRAFDQLKHTRGQFTWTEGAAPPRSPGLPPISPALALFRSKVDEYRQRSGGEIEAAENGLTELFVHRAPDAPSDLSSYGLSPEEQRFWNLTVTGAYTLREISSMSNLARRHTHGVLTALRDLGFARLEPDMAPKHRLERIRQNLFRKAQKVESETLFDVLEVHWMAHDADIAESYARTIKAYTIPPLGIPIPNDIQVMSDLILRRAEEARARLTNILDRREYRKGIVEDAQVQNTAELMLQQGELDFYQSDLVAAERRFSHVLELDPMNPTARGRLKDVLARRGQRVVFAHEAEE